jgi:4-amino-4-deoxy-L-arabinose transferase-like glycosyltransferase
LFSVQTFNDSSLARRNTRWVLAAVFAVHFAFGSAVGLSVDEAHYLLYAAHPALSYFDHPPLVGWVQWPLLQVTTSTVVLRLIPGVLYLASAVLVYGLAQRLQGPGVDAHRAGLWAVLALALAPLLHVLGIGLLPDTLLMFFAAALMWQTMHLMQAAQVQRTGPWLVLGVLLGLAGLAKYTAVLFAAALGVCLLVVHGWQLLRNPRLWMAVLVALAMVSPVVWWNAQNQWISFTYQAQHGSGSAWQASHVLRFLVFQVLAYGPLLLWGVAGWLQVSRRNPRLMVVFFVIPFGVFAAMAGGGSSLPHWTAPAWVALAPFAGVALARAMQGGQRWWVGGFAFVQVLGCTALLGLMLSAGQPLLPVGAGTVPVNANPFADLHGWDAAGQRARALAQQHNISSVAVLNWTLASRLGWYARPLPVHVLQDRFDQFDLWAGDLPVGASTLLVDWSHMAYEVPLGEHGFASCTLLDTQQVAHMGAVIASFRFYACQGWSGTPQPRLAETPKP